MKEYVQHLQAQVDEKLLRIEQQSENMIQQASMSITAMQEALLQLRNHLMKHTFTDREEEIDFFRHTKPKIYARLIYYVRIFQLETKRPGCRQLERELIEEELEELRNFFSANIELVRYYRSGARYLDAQYFLRSNLFDSHLILDDYSFLMDAQFNTTHSYKVAKLLAYEMLERYLLKALETLDQQEDISQSLELMQSMPKWMGSKNDLVEWAYGMHHGGMLDMPVGKIISFFETLFGIKVGNHSAIFQQMCIRKKSRTSFWDKGKTAVTGYMDRLDD